MNSLPSGATLLKRARHGLASDVWRVPVAQGVQVWKDYRRLRGWRAQLARYLVRRERTMMTHQQLGFVPELAHHESDQVLAMEYVCHRPLAEGDGELLLACLPHLAAMHAKGLVHNDIHRSNLCVALTAEPRIILLDFGAAMRPPRWLHGYLSRRDRNHLLSLAARYGARISVPPRSRLSRVIRSVWQALRRLTPARRTIA